MGGDGGRFRRAAGAPLNVLAIEVAAGPGARVLPLGAGLDDGLFEHDGQITKREVRALTLAALAPRRGERLCRHRRRRGLGGDRVDAAAPSLGAVAVEARADRAARIRRNALAFGVPGLAVVEGAAPAALDGLAGAGRGVPRRRRHRSGRARRGASRCCGRAGGWWRMR